MKKEKKINKKCPCTYPGCPRHGHCDECKEYHHSQDQKTSCEKAKK